MEANLRILQSFKKINEKIDDNEQKQKDINIKNEKAKIKNVGNNYDGDIWNNIIIVCVIDLLFLYKIFIIICNRINF